VQKTLRQGITCTVNLPSPRDAFCNPHILGGRNYHGSIEFEDGKTWLARFRLPNHNEPPPAERNFDRRSEFATYKFLAKTSIPIPEVYDWADDDDPVNLGAKYILIEKLPGKPMAWHKASEAQKTKFSKQLSKVYFNLEDCSFNSLGRLQLSSTGQPEVGPAFFDYDSSGNPAPSAPFSTSNNYYTALIQRTSSSSRTRK
jgi:hypothetical protein